MTLEFDSRRWAVYRITFDDGAAYVGITKRSVATRVREHFGGTHWRMPPPEEALSNDWGHPRMLRRAIAGIRHRVETLDQGLFEFEARAREEQEIARLEKPLNCA